MKRIISLVLALMLIASLSVTAFAADEVGSITINGVSSNTTYKIYQLLDLKSYDVAAIAYTYKVNSAWTNFFNTDAAKHYFTIDADGYITWTWKPNTENPITEDEAIANFAKLALQYAKTNGIAATQSYIPGTGAKDMTIDGSSGKFSNLSLGYYLVDSSMGALCGLTTTNPNASVNAKNGIPTVDKQVKEDSTEQWGATDSADIGQTIEYRVTINVHAGAENYILHDTMSSGLTFKGVSKVEHVIPSTDTHEVNASLYEVKTGTDVVSDGCTFEVHFSKEFCDKLETNDKIIVHYAAMLNRDATVNGDGNDNTAWLSFGDGATSSPDKVTTYTYGIDIVKTDSQNTLIDGAMFKIYDAATNGNEIDVVILDAAVQEGKPYLTDSKGNALTWDHDKDNSTPAIQVTSISTYRRARADEEGVEIVVKNGQVRVVGFDNGTYYLQETKAPNGYNELTSRQKFIISDGNLDAVFNDGVFSTGSGVHVVNKKGDILPETGAMGTMMFITFGTLVVMAAGVLLVTKKRMSMIED